jgi:hypothetical protein
MLWKAFDFMTGGLFEKKSPPKEQPKVIKMHKEKSLVQ